MLQATKHGATQQLRQRSSSAARAAPMLRCTCAFSSSCKIYHESTAHNQANAAAYEALFRGISPSSRYLPPRSATAAGYTGSTTTTSTTRNNGQAKPYGPSFKDVPEQSSGRGRRASPRQKGLNPVELNSFRESMDSLFPKQHQARSQPDTARKEGGPSKQAVKWQELLDTLAAKDDLRQDETQTPFHPTPNAESIAEPATSDLFELSRRKERPEDVKEARLLAEELQEQVKQLSDPAEALNWMEARIFSAEDSVSLVNRIADTSKAPSETLIKLYPHLLKDLTDFLRTTAPHASLLPLKIASSHSPASFLAGCTASVYAAAMKTRWEVWGDVEGCAALLEEMERGAVAHNHYIVSMVTTISDALAADTLRASRAVRHERSAADSLAEDQNSSSLFEASDEEYGTHRVYTPQEEREFEKAIEERMFFSPAQRKALTKMEEIVVQHRNKLIEATRKEDMLEDIIRQRERSEWNAPGSSGGTPSDVNLLANSYGQVLPPASDRRHYDVPVFHSSLYKGKGRQFPVQGYPTSTTSRPSRFSENSGEARASRPRDILSEAVEEVAVAPRSRQGRKKGSDREMERPAPDWRSLADQLQKLRLGQTRDSRI